MRKTILAAAVVLLAAPGAFAGFTVSEPVVDDLTVAPGEPVFVTVTVTNDGDRARRVGVAARAKSHPLLGRASLRTRGRASRSRAVLAPGASSEFTLKVDVPAGLLGAVRLDVRAARRTRPLDIYVDDGSDVPDASRGTQLPMQPLLAVSFVYDFDADTSRRELVVRDQAAFDQLLTDVGADPDAPWETDGTGAERSAYLRPTPPDFEKEMVIAVFAGGRPHLDFIRPLRVRADESGDIQFTYRVVRKPTKAFFTTDHQWAPYVFYVVPKSDAAVRFLRR